MTIRRYGLRWDDMDDLQIEMSCIKKGGKWTMGDGKEYGMGLFEHFRKMQNLLWPDEDDHRWSNLMLSTILTNRITVVAGAKDSGKTHTMSKFALTDYFCFPQETLTMMSSTDIRGLELRVWGDVKDLFDRARERFPYLPGNVVDAKHGIFTDALDDTGDVRDMRKGILCIPCIGSSGEFVGISKFVGVKQKRRRLLGDECFPAGTMVDTPSGKKAIESFVPGDVVINAIGIGMVSALLEKRSTSLVRITLEDGRYFDCTPNHPIFTDLGLVNAVDITTGTMLLSSHDTLSCVQEGVAGCEISNPILFKSLSKGNVEKAMQGMRDTVYSERTEGAVLHKEVLLRLEVEATGLPSKAKSCMVRPGFSSETRRGNKQVNSFQQKGAQQKAGFDDKEPAENATRPEVFKACNVQGAASCEPERDDCSCDVSRCEVRFPSEHWKKFKTRELTILPSGSGVAGIETGCGDRRIISQDGEAEGKGSETGQVLSGNRVDRVEILKQDSSLVPYDSKGGYTVYNLQVEGHPSYCVNGVVVANCQFMQQSYLDSMANLDKGNFLGCFVGNPIGNGDPLDKLSEPAIGWDALGDITKTTTWKNKFGGVTINFVGIDSPNFDADKPKSYPYLIDKTDVERIGERYGKDSALFWSQIMGVRKAGINAHRVLTMDMCRKYGAFDSCVWSGSETVKVFGVDAGYGGDLCVGICAEFGTDVTGITAIKFHEPVVIPVRLSAPEIVEDQIATFTKGECMRMGIPDEHVFIEAGMRATLAVSFARIMSPKINAINFGGAATDRPVSNDLFIFDERTSQRRHKKANEHYSKYVTQIYFSVRAAVESKQVRDLPMKVAEEMCMREWYMVHGDRYELETKLECKERLGVSPNFADACVISCEGAIRLGFQIERLKVESATDPQQDSWLDKALKEDRNKRSKYSLTYGH